MSDRATPTSFERPLRATHHCRHYSYERGFEGGPRCAAGVNIITVKPCMPDHDGQCAGRQEYTDAERAAWKAAREGRMARLAAAIGALPRPIPLRSSGTVKCPSCGGTLHYARWHRGGEIHCETEFCCSAHFNIAAGVDWPGSAT